MSFNHLVFFLVCGQTTFAQPKLDSVIESSTCACMSLENNGYKESEEDKFASCVVRAISENLKLLQAEATRKYGEATKETGRQLGQSLREKLLINMVYSCDVYYQWLEEKRIFSIKNANKDSLRNELNRINSIDSLQRNAAFFTTRGLLFFSLEQLDKAIEDFDSAIKTGPTADVYQSMYFKAWSLERQKKYTAALELYSQLAAITKNKNIEVTEAVVRRKMRE